MMKVKRTVRLMALLVMLTMLFDLFPSVYSEEEITETPAEGVVDVTEPEPDPTVESGSEPEPDPTVETGPEPEPEPAPESEPEPESESSAEPEPVSDSQSEPAQESDNTVVTELEQNEETVVESSGEEQEDASEDEVFEDNENFTNDDDELVEFEDWDSGSVSEELLQQFNNPDNFEQVEFSGSADIRVKNEEELFQDGWDGKVTLKAKVKDANLSYRLVWEANDHDDRGWYTVGSGEEYSYTVTVENARREANREYRVVLFSVD